MMRILTVIAIWALVVVLLLPAPAAVEYDLYTNDSWDMAFPSITTTYTISLWAYFTDLSGTNWARLFRTGGGTYLDFLVQHSTDALYYARYSGANLNWTSTASAVTTGAWTHIAIVHDGSDDCDTDPTLYVNGSTVGVTGVGTQTNPCASSTGTPIYLCNVSGKDRAPGARVAEFCVFNDDLTSDQVASLADGFSPMLVAPSLINVYVPMVRDKIELFTGPSFSETGTPTIVPGPRIYR